MAEEDVTAGQFESLDKSEDSVSFAEFEENNDRHPAPITIRATATSNPKKPRTLRAGYESRTGTLTVIFEDGTWWNYYKVPEDMWQAFRAAPSKGRYLRQSGLDEWPDMGVPNMAAMSPQMEVALGKSNLLQKAREGKQSNRITGPRAEAALKRYMRGLGQG